MNIFRINIAFITLIFITGCATQSTIPSYHSNHHYEIYFKDIDEKPIDGVKVEYTIKDLEKIVKQSSYATLADGVFEAHLSATVDPEYIGYFQVYRTDFEFKASKYGYYPKTGSESLYCNSFNTNKVNCTASNDNYNKFSITLIKPSDYFNNDFSLKSSDEKLQANVLSFIDSIILQGLISESILQTRSIKLSEFKGNNYLQFKFNNENIYNSIKLNKYDIGKKLFDDVIRKLLNPLNEHIGKSNLFYGYDITVVGFTKDFIDTNTATPQSIEYRFIMPESAVLKYKEKDISGQQLLDASVILMEDERIDLKLQ